ncbi:MAG: AbgT family transporter [Phycisphaerales bacterium]|jgi:aminobenzoyl-glutamate transport protein
MDEHVPTPSDKPDLIKNRRGALDWIEWLGNKLPDAATLFLLGAIVVMIVSHLAYTQGWSVEVQSLRETVDPTTGEATTELVPTGTVLTAQSLLTSDGLYWCLSSMVANFMGFAPLGVVLTGMLGIGVAEKTGLIGAGLKAFMKVVPNQLLTPAMVFLGIMSSFGLDAGYVVLPPLAALLYKSVGRSPLAGIAAVFAGVAAGFNANLVVTGLDPMLAALSTQGAQIIDADYQVAATCNWWFMIVSTFVITGVGWATSAWFVERRLSRKSIEEGGPAPIEAVDLESQQITPTEQKGLVAAALTGVVVIGIIVATVVVKDWPLYDYQVPGVATVENPDPDPSIADRVKLDGEPVAAPETMPEGAVVVEGAGYYTDASLTTFVTDSGEVLQKRSPPFARWVVVITPLIFIGSIVPGMVYGLVTGSIKSTKDAGAVMIKAIEMMAPIIVLAFFAAQFIQYMSYSGLDVMMAHAGGQSLATSGLSNYGLVVAFIVMTMFFNLFIGSMSAKYTLFAPIFVPMLMFVGISPELTQAAYRIGDSTTNIITPLNAYLVIILVFMQRFAPRSGMGTLISMMMPYTIVFAIVWTIMLLAWMALGLELGPNGPLTYSMAAG